MTLRRGLLFGFTATALLAQKAPFIDRDQVNTVVQEALQAKQHELAEKGMALSEDVLWAKRSMATDALKRAQEELWAHKDKFAHIPHGLFLAQDSLAMHKPFFQDLKGSGGPLTEDEELKSMAIDGLMQSDADRAIPVVDKLLQNPQASLRLRMRALQALGRSNSPKAREIVVRVAKDSSTPELQSRALRMLDSRDSPQNSQLLDEIYASTTNVEAKRQILRSWARMGAKEPILKVAKSDSSIELRAAAVSQLGGMRAVSDLAALYSSESSTEIRERLIRALADAGDWQKLMEIAKTEKNEDLRSRAIRQAGAVRGSGASEALVELYNATPDSSTRNAILRALSHQGNAKQLIAVARKETNPELKRAALQHLSHMKGEDVTAYLMELLNK